MNYVIIDFEATCSDKDEFPREEMEIIEFAALCVREDFSSAFLFDFFVSDPYFDHYSVDEAMGVAANIAELFYSLGRHYDPTKD